MAKKKTNWRNSKAAGSSPPPRAVITRSTIWPPAFWKYQVVAGILSLTISIVCVSSCGQAAGPTQNSAKTVLKRDIFAPI